MVKQATFSSAQLKDAATGEPVDGGADIPLEQILVGPRRSLLSFEDSGHDRSLGQMLRGEVPKGSRKASQLRDTSLRRREDGKAYKRVT